MIHTKPREWNSSFVFILLYIINISPKTLTQIRSIVAKYKNLPVTSDTGIISHLFASSNLIVFASWNWVWIIPYPRCTIKAEYLTHSGWSLHYTLPIGPDTGIRHLFLSEAWYTVWEMRKVGIAAESNQWSPSCPSEALTT